MSLFSRKKFGVGHNSKSGVPDGLWIKCPGCRQTIYRTEMEENLKVCPQCALHFRMGARTRISVTVDPGSFEEMNAHLQTADPLRFTVGSETYLERVERARRNSGLEEALVTGRARLEEVPVFLGVMDPEFIMGSMGSVVGEKFCRMASAAVAEHTSVIVFCASGGARMQEGILALMQMAKTADAVREMNEAHVPYISVLTDPTTGGVWASFASLGDIILAEPGAYIGFAGKRLIEGSMKVKLPEGFQSAEYQMQNGFVDAIVKRHDMRACLSRLIRFLVPKIP